MSVDLLSRPPPQGLFDLPNNPNLVSELGHRAAKGGISVTLR